MSTIILNVPKKSEPRIGNATSARRKFQAQVWLLMAPTPYWSFVGRHDGRTMGGGFGSVGKNGDG